MAVRAKTATPIPSPSLSRRRHHSSNHISRTTTHRPFTTATTPPWWRRRTQEAPSMPSPLPPLLQRPHHPSPTNQHHHPLLPSLDNHEYVDDEDNRGVLAAASDVLALLDSLQLPVETDLYLSLLKECTAARDAVQGAYVHAHIQRHRGSLLKRPAGLLLANRLLLLYAATGHTESARQVFDEMPVRNAITWATVMVAHSDAGNHREALQLFVDGWSAGKPAGCCFAVAVTAVLRLCLRTGELNFGQQIHGLMLKMVAQGGDYWQLGSPLVQFYTTMGHYRSVQKVFDGMCSQDTAAWACSITACCRDDEFKEAFFKFREMGRAGARKNCYTFSSILPACAKMEDEGWSGRQVHGIAIKAGVDFDRFVGSSLVGMYAKCGLLKDARRAFEASIGRGCFQDAVCWNAMLSGYAQRGCSTEAIRFLYEMKAAGMEPQESVLELVRTVCGSCVYNFLILRQGIVFKDDFLGGVYIH